MREILLGAVGLLAFMAGLGTGVWVGLQKPAQIVKTPETVIWQTDCPGVTPEPGEALEKL